MTVAVTTPTGNVGSYVVAGLIRAGIHPRVLMRHPDALSPEVAAYVDVAVVDQFDTESVVAATRDVHSLFWVDPTTGSKDPLGDYDRAARAVAAAVTSNAIARVVFQSSVGAEKRHGVGEIDGLAATETALDATNADVTHLRCGYFFTNLLLQLDSIRSGTVPVVVPLDQPMPWVAPRDIAEVAVTRLLSTGWSGRHVQAVHGPADLTWTQAAQVITAGTGHPVHVERIEDDQMRDLLRNAGMTGGLIDAVIGMSTGLRDGFVPEQPRSLLSTTPTSLGAWAYDVLRPLI